MLTPCKVSSCKVCSSAAEGEGSLGIPPQTWDFFAPRIPAPVLWLHWAGASGCRAFSSCPSTETKGSAPQRTSQPRRCGRCQFCSWFWEACGSGTRRKEVRPSRMAPCHHCCWGRASRDLLECLGLVFEVAPESRGELGVCACPRVQRTRRRRDSDLAGARSQSHG